MVGEGDIRREGLVSVSMSAVMSVSCKRAQSQGQGQGQDQYKVRGARGVKRPMNELCRWKSV